MVRTAEQTATSAEQTTTNSPGYCLQWSRERATIAALFPDATTAWRHAMHRRVGDRQPPRGAMVYWTGGSHGYGHIAVALGGGMVRSTDAGGAGRVATVELGWVERNWGLPYGGWADNVNDVVIPGVVPDDNGGDPMPQYDHATRKTSQRLKGGEWWPVEWSDVAAGPAFKAGQPGADLAGRRFSAVFSASLTGVTPGDTIRTQCVEFASGAAVETYPMVEHRGTGGTTYVAHSQLGSVADKPGRVLRFRVQVPDDGCQLTAADAIVLSW